MRGLRVFLFWVAVFLMDDLLEHAALGSVIHLFVRETKLRNAKAAPFLYCGPVLYVSHSGSKPMSVVFDVPEMA